MTALQLHCRLELHDRCDEFPAHLQLPDQVGYPEHLPEVREFQDNQADPQTTARQAVANDFQDWCKLCHVALPPLFVGGQGLAAHGRYIPPPAR